MKKLIVLLMTIMLAAALPLAGCTTKQQNPTSGSGAASENQKDAESAQDESGNGQDHDASSRKISRKEAVQIVLSRVDGAKESDIHELEADHDDGQFVYEGELHYGGYEYDFEIDGETGEIIRWEIDRG